jgi:hypothetical protein
MSWHPVLKDWDKTEQQHNIEQTAQYLTDRFDISVYFDSGGGPQFTGLSTIINDESWEKSKIYWKDDTFVRRAYEPDRGPPFSGDQFVGILFSLYWRHQTKGLTTQEKDNLEKIFKRLWFKERIGCFPKIDGDNRGRILNWFAFGPEMMQIRATTKFCKEIFGGFTYKIMDFLVKLHTWPSYICADHGVWIKNLYITAWYSNHTMAVYTWMVGNKRGLKLTARRHPYNAEIQAFAYNLTKQPVYKERVLDILKYFPKDLMDTGGHALPDEIKMKKFINVKSFKIEEYPEYILPCKYRSHKWIWEKAPNEPRRRKYEGWYGNFLVSYHLVK